MVSEQIARTGWYDEIVDRKRGLLKHCLFWDQLLHWSASSRQPRGSFGLLLFLIPHVLPGNMIRNLLCGLFCPRFGINGICLDRW
jgi:hypothetical protein